MQTLAIDIETFSSVDLKTSGVYKYVEAPDFEIMLFSYCFDDGPIRCIDLKNGEAIPYVVINALTSPYIIKKAFNATFERVCIEKYLMLPLIVNQWSCTLVRCAYGGLPLNLEQAAASLKVSAQKDKLGHSLIRYFCIPCKPSAANDFRTRNLPSDNPAKWEQFKQYNISDVKVERAIDHAIAHIQLPEREQQLYKLDQKINNVGIRVQPDLVNNAIAFDERNKKELTREAVLLTGIKNPNSVAQLKTWLIEEMDEEITTLNKEAIPGLIKNAPNAQVKRLLEIRQAMGKTSVKKYKAILKSICTDGRVHGLFQFMGANRTHRWAGRLAQLHNLPQNKSEDLDVAREILLMNDYDLMKMFYKSIGHTLSELIRTAFIPAPGKKFIVVDLSAIEARIIAWLAKEKWRLDVFKTHGKIYEASASRMFNIPLNEITKDLRQQGKVAELALGFGGAVNALQRMDTKKAIPFEEYPKIVKLWRKESPNICILWKVVERAAKDVVSGDYPVMTIYPGITFRMQQKTMFIKLPSGKELAYFNARIEDDGDGYSTLMYEGIDIYTKKWGKIKTYGGKLVENIVQAIARDVLAEAMIRIDKFGYTIPLHVHDEIVCEVPDNSIDHLTPVVDLMKQPIPWAEGLLLDAEGFETYYYKK